MRSLNMCSETSLDDDWQLYMAVACGERCIENVSLTFSCTTNTSADIRERFSSHWGDYFAFKKDVWPLTLKIVELRQNTDDRNKHPIKPGVIVTRCTTTSLRLAKAEVRPRYH